MNYQDIHKRFTTLHLYATENEDACLTFIDEAGDSLIAAFSTAYETDNGLDLNDSEYEEYFALAFRELNTGELFEITYHNLPAEVWNNNYRVI